MTLTQFAPIVKYSYLKPQVQIVTQELVESLGPWEVGERTTAVVFHGTRECSGVIDVENQQCSHGWLVPLR